MPLVRMIVVAFTLFALLEQAAVADPLWTRFVPSKKVEADPNGDYRLTRDVGPWMIIATAFSGDGAADQADELVLELRKRYKLEAFTYERSFDLTERMEGRGVDRSGQPMRMRYRRSQDSNAIHEVAVLVGNYPAYDDPQAQKILHKIKHMLPDSLDHKKRKRTSQSMAGLRAMQAALLPDGDERKHRGPMGKAFVSRNPMLPKEMFVAQSVDSFLEKINSDVKFSLLECPGKFTVKVATFTGKVVLDPKKVQQIQSGQAEWKNRLDRAGDNAERMAIALREKGYQAYAFHERTASMVTVGAFDSVGTPRNDGKIEINPEVHKLLQVFQAAPRTGVNALPAIKGALNSHNLKAIVGIPFDLQPQIVHVPQRSVSAAYFRQ